MLTTKKKHPVFSMSSTEEKAYMLMCSLGVDYVLAIYRGIIGYSGEDINQFVWMVRIAEGKHPQDIKVRGKYIRILCVTIYNHCIKLVYKKCGFECAVTWGIASNFQCFSWHRRCWFVVVCEY